MTSAGTRAEEGKGEQGEAPTGARSKEQTFATDRQRRCAFLGRLLPVIGFILLMLPMLWHGAEPVRTSQVMLYIFTIWLVLILATWLFRRVVANAPQEPPE